MATTLIILEHDGGHIKNSSLGAVTFARGLDVPYVLGVLGSELEDVAEAASGFGATEVWMADDPLLAEPLADRYAAVIADWARKLEATTVVGTASTFAKDVLPRAAALLGAPMVSDVISMEVRNGEKQYRRPVQSGSAIARVRMEGDLHVVSVRATAFAPPPPDEGLSPVRRVVINPASLPAGTRFISREERGAGRPDLGDARVVVSGGRPLQNRETFDRLIGGLADALGGAVGATRAAVDAGMVSNDCQVGQTGKTVAPELYIAVGVSGAIQHLAGILDSRVIVAINRDPEAAVFQVANYGLVGDLHTILPEFIAAVRKT